MKHFLFLAFFSFLLIGQVNSQELNCSVTINSQQIEGSENAIFEDMQKAIYEFVNSRKWTSTELDVYEKIECNMLITLKERVSGNTFKGTIQIQARRPVYNTGYHSPTVNILDKNFTVTFNRFEPLQYSESSYISELSSIISYYVYVILAYDYDSFSLEGGTAFFEQAQKIVTNAQGSANTGWKAFEGDKNRYWLVENALNSRFQPLRELYYNYHRKGFDVMSEDLESARKQITQSLKSLLAIHNSQPGSYNLQVFFDAKADEISNLYKQAPESVRKEITELLIRIDPGNTSKYQEMEKGK